MARVASLPLPRLPSVDLVLRDPACAALLERYGRAPVTEAVRAELAAERAVGGTALAVPEVLARVEHSDVGLAFARLSPDLQAVVQATVLDGLTTREAAALLGIPSGTVKSRMSRARTELREALL